MIKGIWSTKARRFLDSKKPDVRACGPEEDFVAAGRTGKVMRATCTKPNNQLMIILRPKLSSLRQFPDFQFLHERGPRLFFRCSPRKSHIHSTIHSWISKSPQCGFDLHSIFLSSGKATHLTTPFLHSSFKDLDGLFAGMSFAWMSSAHWLEAFCNRGTYDLPPQAP